MLRAPAALSIIIGRQEFNYNMASPEDDINADDFSTQPAVCRPETVSEVRMLPGDRCHALYHAIKIRQHLQGLTQSFRRSAARYMETSALQCCYYNYLLIGSHITELPGICWTNPVIHYLPTQDVTVDFEYSKLQMQSVHVPRIVS